MSATSWLTVVGVLLVTLVGGALIGVPVGVTWERSRRARRMRERARRALRDAAPTLVMPAIPPAPTAQEMRAYIGPTCRADRSRP